MLRQFIAPVQAWLLKHNQCVGCGRSLDPAKSQPSAGKTKITCKCGRIFIKEGEIYRRALFEEV